MPYAVVVEWAGQEERHEGLPGTLVESIDLFGSLRYQPRTLAVRDWRFRHLVLRDQLQAGHRLSEAVARVYLGDDLVLSGRLRRPRVSADGERVSFTIEERAQGSVTWPAVETVQVPVITRPVSPFRPKSGQPPGIQLVEAQLTFPVVFGTPGQDAFTPPSGSESGAGSPGVYLDDVSGWVIAGHAVADSTVGVQLEDGTSVSGITVREATVAGALVSYVLESDLDPGLYDSADRPDEVFIVWSSGGLSGKLSDVLRYLTDYIPRRVWTERIQAASPALDRYRIDTYFAEGQPIEDVLASVVEHLPVSLVQGASGLWVWVWDPDAPPLGTLRVPVDHTEATGVRGGAARYAEGEPYRSFRVRYLHTLPADKPRMTTTTQGAQYRVTDRQIDGSDEIVDAIHICDTATAQRCADLRMRARGRPPTIVSLQVDRSVWARLGVGDCVTLDHPRGGLAGRKGWITRCSDAGTDVLDIEVTITEPLPGEP